ncbi:MAG: fatty acid desaturase [Myxococcales bacterium]|nr:fatty acid desaturase [Myxococcales bacterium]MBL0197771.1 fatty acid desaturase [Myxococcales bacterium]HQY60225.1 fatty acid desaturase [Polyangiaceae bacterium]
MLRYRADIRTLGFVGFYYAFLAFALWAWSRVGVGSRVGLVVVLMCVSWFCAVITHNSLHTPVFRQRWANKIFQVLLTCSYGFPVSEYVPGHNLSHHKFTQERRDIMRTTKVDYGWNLLSFLMFFPTVAVGVTRANYKYTAIMKTKLPKWHRQLQLELVFAWGSKAILFLLDWRSALFLVLVPHLWAVWGITSVNYLQHDGCDQNHPVNHSRNFMGRIFNWFTFNNGFHGIHHEEPGLHWSLLREEHMKRLHPTIHPELEQPSLFLYLLRAFVWPGKRVRFDGAPYVVPADGPDENWIPEKLPGADLGAEGAIAVEA